MNPGFHKLLENTFVADIYKIRPVNSTLFAYSHLILVVATFIWLRFVISEDKMYEIKLLKAQTTR